MSTDVFVAPSTDKLAQAVEAVESLSDQIDKKSGPPSSDDVRQLAAAVDGVRQLKRAVHREEMTEAKKYLASLGADASGPGARSTGIGSKSAWSAEAASRITKTVGAYGIKAITTGGVDVPQPVESLPVTMPVAPARVLELLINRKPLEGNVFSYLQQTRRDNAAAPVADNQVKPTSVYTFEDVEDKAKVIAHLSEAIPLRYLEDHDELRRVLSDQMAEDLYAVIEEEALLGDGTGEHFRGLSNTVGVRAQPFSGNVLQTLRKARTTLTIAGETPTAWVLNWTDVEAIDLLREDGATGGFMADIDAKIFGNLPTVGSNLVPAGTAFLGDWNQTRLYVRDAGRLDADVSGPLFDRNQFKLRYEGRFGFAVLRPAAFVAIDLAA